MDVLDAVRCAVIWTWILPWPKSEWSRLVMMGDGLHGRRDETSPRIAACDSTMNNQHMNWYVTTVSRISTCIFTITYCLLRKWVLQQKQHMSTAQNFIKYDLGVRHPCCVGLITKNFVYYAYSRTQLCFI